MIALLFGFCHSFHFGPDVIELSDSNFEPIIDKRKNLSVFFVMFSGDHCPACQASYPAFSDAAKDSIGMVNFAHVDANNNPRLSQRFEIRSIPTFKIFHSKGETHYAGERQSRSFVNAAAKYILDLSVPVNDTWLSNETKAAILFSAKPQTPPLWAAISNNFTGTNVQIGFSKESSLRSKFNVSKVPAILFLDGGMVINYKGKNTYQDVQAAIVDHFNVEFPKEPTPTPRPKPTKKSSVPTVIAIGNKQKFDEICKNTSKFCVFETSDKPSQEFIALATKYRNDPFKFVTCAEKCPMERMSGSAWIFHTRRDSAIKVSSIGELGADIDRIVDGTPKWAPLAGLLSEKEL